MCFFLRASRLAFGLLGVLLVPVLPRLALACSVPAAPCSRFEVADLWCAGVDVRSYVVFIHSLLESIAHVKFELPSPDQSNEPVVAKVELKKDEAINHDRFVHDVDKGTVTGTVFRELEIPDAPEEEEDDLLAEESTQCAEELDNVDDESFVGRVNSLERMQEHGRFEIVDDEESTDEEEDYTKLLAAAEAAAARPPTGDVLAASGGSSSSSAAVSRPRTGTPRLLFAGSGRSRPGTGSSSSSRRRQQQQEQEQEQVVPQERLPEASKDGDDDGSDAVKKKKKKAKKSGNKNNKRKKKKINGGKGDNNGAAAFVKKDLAFTHADQAEAEAEAKVAAAAAAAAEADRARKRQEEIDLRARQAHAAADAAAAERRRRAKELAEEEALEAARRRAEEEAADAAARLAAQRDLLERPISPLPDPDRDATLNAISATANAVEGHDEAVRKDMAAAVARSRPETAASARSRHSSKPGTPASSVAPPVSARSVGEVDGDGGGGGGGGNYKPSTPAGPPPQLVAHGTTTTTTTTTIDDVLNASVRTDGGGVDEDADLYADDDDDAGGHHRRNKTEVMVVDENADWSPSATMDSTYDGNNSTIGSLARPVARGGTRTIDRFNGISRLNSDGTINIWVNDGRDAIVDTADDGGEDDGADAEAVTAADLAVGRSSTSPQVIVPRLPLDTLIPVSYTHLTLPTIYSV